MKKAMPTTVTIDGKGWRAAKRAPGRKQRFLKALSKDLALTIDKLLKKSKAGK